MEILIIPVPKLSYCRWSPVFICCLRSIGVLPRCLQLISLCPYCIYCDQLIIYQFYIDHFRIDFVLQHCLIFFFVLLLWIFLFVNVFAIACTCICHYEEFNTCCERLCIWEKNTCFAFIMLWMWMSDFLCIKHCP